ncbi:hypothetical protein P4N68_09330 [Corynebacterium felinum]|uniref:Nucleic acid-binding Zn-ribbon protein n=1 Tax=Corynebacterium felinum TaxID=131318 RepID=A0ABU2B9B6_9CORY|nr:hypothetical protein [Corynebacterium felinum]MDF5821276.1 hypothetical protein [Corynebacterium felinum]MDR7355203.1 putative nucleic acid-binding Zn-ribbon protein [Corynebacterium felinum]WJY94554.1 Chromosome partition protein Smc [Corynebacterium felinum]
MRVFRAILASLITAALIPLSPAFAQTPVVNQGDLILVQDSRGISYNCTAGYVDKKNARIWTAGHCSHHGSIVYNEQRVAVGTLKHRYNVSENVDHLRGEERRKATADYFFHDISYVDLIDPAMAGANTYSGDRPYTPTAGEQLCRFGATTRAVYCASIFNVTDHLIYVANLNTQGGDSGGPAWVPGEGYVGQAVGAFNFTNREGRSLVMTIIHREDLAQIVPQRTASEGFEHYIPTENELLINSYAIRNANTVFGRDLPDADEFARILRRHEQELKAAEQRVADAEAKLRDASNAHAHAHELAAARAELDALKRKLADADTTQREKNQLATQLEQARAEITSLRTQLNQANASNTERATLAQALKNAQEELTRLKAQLAESTTNNTATDPAEQDNQAQLRAELHAAQEQIAALKAEIAQLSTRPQNPDTSDPGSAGDRDSAGDSGDSADASNRALEQLQAKHDKLKKESTIGIIVAIAAAVFGLIAAFFGWFGKGLKIPT